MFSTLSTLFGFILLLADLYALFQIVQSKASTPTKVIWALIVLFFPFIGLVAWFFIGPSKTD